MRVERPPTIIIWQSPILPGRDTLSVRVCTTFARNGD